MNTLTLDKIKQLPVSKQQEVEDFVDFLVSKYINTELASESLAKRRLKSMGRFKGKIFISEDFNETPSDFKDYI
ncbi:DUF2281 domain-containing protein [Pedobacter sp. SD-b]|uniref:DUF2281 domain-containing protein n=1 Tax=Pedobacter segetis TaxID=2793069 RepID=A0ABS1BLG7_9SPHI|nr:DUF2281 domain-containing protein [Pedobacter segetis]MBK0383686.1 DUF2281 domain-containing protein [Pedobacter segetis]